MVSHDDNRDLERPPASAISIAICGISPDQVPHGYPTRVIAATMSGLQLRHGREATHRLRIGASALPLGRAGWGRRPVWPLPRDHDRGAPRQGDRRGDRLRPTQRVNTLICDSGPLIASFNPGDHHHARCVRLLASRRSRNACRRPDPTAAGSSTYQHPGTPHQLQNTI